MMFSAKKSLLLAAAVCWATTCMAQTNSALQFNGTTDYVQLTSSPVTELTENFTLEAWAELTSSTGYHRILSNFGSQPSRGIGFGAKDTRWRFTTFGVKDYDTALGAVTTGTWTHIAVVYDSSFTATWYRDGQFLQQIPFDKPLILSTSTLTIGRNPTDATSVELWEGRIDEIRVWNYARSLTEIRADMGRMLWGDEAGLILYFPFSEGSGTTTADASPNTADGTLNGCTWAEGPPLILPGASARGEWSLYP